MWSLHSLHFFLLSSPSPSFSLCSGMSIFFLCSFFSSSTFLIRMRSGCFHSSQYLGSLEAVVYVTTMPVSKDTLLSKFPLKAFIGVVWMQCGGIPPHVDSPCWSSCILIMWIFFGWRRGRQWDGSSQHCCVCMCVCVRGDSLRLRQGLRHGTDGNGVGGGGVQYNGTSQQTVKDWSHSRARNQDNATVRGGGDTNTHWARAKVMPGREGL